MLEQKTLATQATEYLETLIIEGGLEEGAALPPQAEIAARLGVSRLVVREATKTLEARGLIKAQQGKRLVVAHRAIHAAVSARDPEAAAAAMNRHLNEALVDLLASAKQRPSH